MPDAADEESNVRQKRGRRVWRTAVLAVVLLIGGFMWWQQRQNACADWQRDFRAAVDEVAENAAGTQDDAARFVVLLMNQPDGCARPEIPIPERTGA